MKVTATDRTAGNFEDDIPVFYDYRLWCLN